MSRTRYHMRNATHMVEAEKTPEGLNALTRYRMDHPEFRKRRIREVIQSHPSKIPVLTAIELS